MTKPRSTRCDKKRYPTAALARQAARKLFWSTDVRAASVYWHADCHAWHVTGRPGRRGGWRRF